MSASVSFIKLGQYVIAAAVILSILFCSFQYLHDPFDSIDKTSNSAPIQSETTSLLDYNELFSNRIHRPPPSNNNNVRMIFVIGFDEYERNVFEYIFDEFAKNNDRIMHISKASDLSKQFEKCWFSESNIENVCNMAQEKLNIVSSTDRILLISSFIFPFSFLNIYRFPDLFQLIEWTKNAKPNGIDLKYLLLSRDYKKSLIHCVKFKDCNERILSLSHYLNSMHAQIMQMDKTYFIQINFTHFVQNTLAYDHIFESLLGTKTKTKKLKPLPTEDALFEFSEEQMYAINESFYSLHARHRWPLFSNPEYVTSPTHAQSHHKIDYNKLFSHFLKKQVVATPIDNKRLTMIFIVGVEGVGHHFFRSFFENLHKINSFQYVHERDRPWPMDPLWLIMDQCWSFDAWSLIKEASFISVKRSDLKQNERGMRMCEVAQKQINELSASMSNNSVLFMSTHFSFPYDDPLPNRYPDFVQLIEWAQNAKPSPFDVRLLVLKRDYETSLISTCIKRFGKCTERIFLLANMLNVIHAQLLQIDASFWIQLNYADFVRNMTEYIPILSDWMNVKMEDVERAIDETKKEYKKHKKEEKKKKNEKLSDERKKIIQQMYYKQSNQWPLFANEQYVVSVSNWTENSYLAAK